jgi:hypothetical protein
MLKKIIPTLNLSIFSESQINQNTTISLNTDFYKDIPTNHRAYVKKLKTEIDRKKKSYMV